jgi:hypothetical protein
VGEEWHRYLNRTYEKEYNYENKGNLKISNYFSQLYANILKA